MPRDNLAHLLAFIAVARERSFTRAAERGTTSVAFALAWVMKNRIVSSTIADPRTKAHRDSDIDPLTLEPGPDDERFVDSLVPPGHASTHGQPDPGYPVEGRKV
ncbi:hypothetical protein WS93_32190 [Burkholderia cepacia]|uniref:HTH lysR-type domain-containing protein n=1 Tax=Burkholderia cepacia TaxID=292 RepID=A0A103ZEI9_BURCE|nr:hypothetical protein WS90_19980 [Burkholderia cepacia]KVK91651.1 hypothetical protein WS93_32190 [Burkholderia cepacia]